jgi:hypothetical protein
VYGYGLALSFIFQPDSRVLVQSDRGMASSLLASGQMTLHSTVIEHENDPPWHRQIKKE